MIREKVSIVLNEREPEKAHAAAALVSLLGDSGITASREVIDEHVVARIAEYRPHVVILDYVLGDYATGFDLLERIKPIPPSERPEVIFLTDEPSAQVAVQAMRLGARHYLPIDHPQSLRRAVEECREALAGRVRNLEGRLRAPDEALVANSPRSAEVEVRLMTAIASRKRLFCFSGVAGSGKTFLAHRAAALLPGSLPLITVDLTLLPGAASELLSGNLAVTGGLRPLEDCSLIVRNADVDDGELLECLLDDSNSPASGARRGVLALIATEERSALAFARIPGIEHLRTPALSERAEDFEGLVFAALNRAESLLGQRIRQPSSQLVSTLRSRSWPEETEQLMNAVCEGAIRSTITSQSLEASIVEVAEWSIEVPVPASVEPEPFEVALMYRSSGRRVRATAARLGCTVQTVRKMLLEYSSSESSEDRA